MYEFKLIDDKISIIFCEKIIEIISFLYNQNNVFQEKNNPEIIDTEKMTNNNWIVIMTINNFPNGSRGDGRNIFIPFLISFINREAISFPFALLEI